MYIDASVLCLHICLGTQMRAWFQWKLKSCCFFFNHLFYYANMEIFVLCDQSLAHRGASINTKF